MYKLFLTLRYLRKRYIAWFAIAAVTLCVAMVLIVMSVMGGFLEQLKLRARGLLGDIVVDNRAYQGFPLYQEFIDDVKQWPEIVEATPVVYTFGLLRFQQTDQTSLVRVVGIRLEEAFRVNAFRDSLFYDRYYPDATSLGEQRQPLLGVDHAAEPILVHDDDGTLLGEILPPLLPEPFRGDLDAFRQKYATEHRGPFPGPEDAAETTLNKQLREVDLPPIPGVWDFNGFQQPPTMDGDPFPGLIIGRDIVAKRLSDGRYDRYRAYPRGCVLTVTLLPRDPIDPTPVKQPFRYTDDSRTGIYEIDSQHVYCDFDVLQRIVMMDAAEYADGSGVSPARCSQIQIKLAPGVDAEALDDRLEQHYHSLAGSSGLSEGDRNLIRRIEAMTWEESQAHVIAPVEKERLLVTMLLGIISLVATVLTMCILYMIVLQKTRDIGIVKSIGGSSGGVAAIFFGYGLSIGVVGAVLGLAIGVLFVTYINQVQAFLIWLHPALQVWDRSVYSFDDIPNTVKTADVIRVAIVAMLTSTIGAFAAARRAGSMQPVEALRYE